MAPPPKAPSSNRSRPGGGDGPRRPRTEGSDKRPGGKAEAPGKSSSKGRSDAQGKSRTGVRSDTARPDKMARDKPRANARSEARPDRTRSDAARSERTGSERPKSNRTGSDRTRPERASTDRPRADRSRPDAPRADRPRGDRPRPDARTPSRDARRTDDNSRSRPVRRPSDKPKAAPVTRSPDRPEGDRIAKLLARAGIASRREIERMIEEGRIALNGTVIETPATILKSLHGITVDGTPVKQPEPARLFLFHKPAGCLTAERDPVGRPTIYDRLPQDIDLPRLMPVGRLDYSTEGLLLLTNDGEFKRLLELPSTGVERTYRARAFGEISQEQLEELVMGIEIDGMKYGRIDANLERRTGRNTWVEMTLTEGKNREVRRVLEHFGLEVSRLIRTRYGPFVLGDSSPGEIEEVRRHDLIVFRNSLEKASNRKPVE